MAKNQLHQLLAVEADLVNKAAKIANETKATFQSKSDHFDGHVREYLPFVEPENPLMKPEPDIKEIVTTVQAKLDYNAGAMIRAIDAKVSKDSTNSSGLAVADVEINGIAYSLSSTALLSLEGYLTKIRDVYDAIPTLDPSKHWDPTAAPGVYEAAPRDTFRTEKVAEPVVKYPATPEHPAQTEMVTLDKNVGIVRTVSTSGRFSPREKSDMLGRIDALLVVVKKARAAANRVEVQQIKVGREVFNYIHNGPLAPEDDDD